MSSYIRTYTGKEFYPLDPDPEQIDIIDIAHALSNVCRYTGHLSSFYGVGDHSIYVSQISSVEGKETALWGLLHDASEAYIADVARPVKHHPDFQFYRDAEDKLMKAVCIKFGLSEEMPAMVKEADNRMLVTEMRDLGMPGQFPWESLPWSPYSFKLKTKTPKKVEKQFLDLFNIYTENRNVTANGKS